MFVIRIAELVRIANDRRESIARRGDAFTTAVRIAYERIVDTRPR